MIRLPRSQSGFTAVELLVTLFVAAAFIIAGYQLFNVVIKDGGETRAKSTAANTAYAYLRQYSDAATNPCSSITPLTNEAINVDTLSQVTVSVTIQCAQPDAPTLSKVDVIINYNVNPQQTLTYSSYIDKSKGATLNTDITDGLVGWWQLNGNTNTSVGSSNGTAYNIQPATGQNGQVNGAYSFNGTDGYISIPGTWGGSTTTAVTISVWYKGAATSGTFQALIQPTDTNYIHLSLFSSGNNVVYTNVGPISLPMISQSTGAWHHAVVTTVSGSSFVYLDGAKLNPTAVSTTFANLTATTSLQIGRGYLGGRYFNGDIDDVRIYSRALSPSEVLQLYTGGAK